MKPKPLTPAMLRALQIIERGGEPTDPDEWNHAPESLWFHSMNKVIGALLNRGLILNDGNNTLTDAGRAALERIEA